MILCFSGTGNTRYAAGLLAEHLGQSVRVFTPDELRNPSNASFESSDQIVVWAFPTYSWGIPPVVAEIMKHARFSDEFRNARHYMLTTCGDDVGLIERQWRRIFRRRGLDTAQAYAVEMPNTYTVMKGFDVDAPGVAKAKLDRAPETVALIAGAIKDGAPGDILIRKNFSWFKSVVIYPWFIRHAMSPRPFHANAGCTGCGACARACPMANIIMKETPDNGHSIPTWDDACAGCLRCYHICPRHAVRYGKSTDTKGQYICRKGLGE